jgi:hypothetical protein
VRGPDVGTERKSRCNLWHYVIPHFEQFLAELELKPSQRLDAMGKAERVARSLFARYYPDQDWNPRCFLMAGSVGKGTAIRPPSDVDLNFVLPRSDFHRIQGLAGDNKQSQFLQEVKRTLLVTYPNTDIRGDGPVVKVPFSTYYFEVCPTFLCDYGTYLTAHTKNNGSWHYSNPHAEYRWLQDVDKKTNGKATHLIKMLKAWKRTCNVELKSICIEILAILFVDQWHNNDKTMLYYDWMVRDFFAYLLQYEDHGRTKPAGILEWIEMGDNWQTKARSAYDRAIKACEYEHADQWLAASWEWQKIFGLQFKTNWAYLLSAGVGA